MGWLYTSEKESPLQKRRLVLRMLGSLSIGALIAYSVIYLVLNLFFYAKLEDFFINSNCDKKCSQVLIMTGWFTLVPYVCMLFWAAFTYFTEIILQRKLKDAPRRALGLMSIAILLYGGLTSYLINQFLELPVMQYLQVIDDWRDESLTEATIESLNARIQKILNIRISVNVNEISE